MAQEPAPLSQSGAGYLIFVTRNKLVFRATNMKCKILFKKIAIQATALLVSQSAV
jgi:hypothetical protein